MMATRTYRPLVFAVSALLFLSLLLFAPNAKAAEYDVYDQAGFFDAIAAILANPGTGTININSSFTLSQSTPPFGGNITINGNGNTITCGAGVQYALQISSNATVVVNDLTVRGASVAGIYADGARSLTVTNCTLQNNFHGIYANDLPSGASVSITGCTFTKNTASQGSGGGVSINSYIGTNNITARLENCVFTDNMAPYGGGAHIQLSGNNSTAIVTGCTFTGNSATTNGSGGGLYSNAGATTITGCTFTENSASDGGAVLMFNGTVEDCLFDSNFARAGNGGALWSGNDNGSDLTVKNSEFYSNHAEKDGGAIYKRDTDVLFAGMNYFDYNSAENGNDDEYGVFLSGGAQMQGGENRTLGRKGTGSSPLPGDFLSGGGITYMTYRAETDVYSYTGGDLTITSNGPFARFTGLRCGNQTLTEGIHYSAREGSTIVTVFESYMKTLSGGTHTFTLLFNNGRANLKIPVSGISVPDEVVQDAPKTGDSPFAWVGAVCLLCAVAAINRKWKMEKGK